jgi:protein tyrosine phosphatase (PTP) superfamily phosphohydrolase (DUF442 family)
MSASLVGIDDRVAISGQLQPEDMKVAAAGYVAVVNSRPTAKRRSASARPI